MKYTCFTQNRNSSIYYLKTGINENRRNFVATVEYASTSHFFLCPRSHSSKLLNRNVVLLHTRILLLKPQLYLYSNKRSIADSPENIIRFMNTKKILKNAVPPITSISIRWIISLPLSYCSRCFRLPFYRNTRKFSGIMLLKQQSSISSSDLHFISYSK